MYENILHSLLSGLVDGRVYPDVTPDNPTFPLIIYQQVGGQDYAYVENKLPSHRNARVRIIVCSKGSLESNNLIRKCEQAIIERNIFEAVQIVGSFTTSYIDSVGIYEATQDFSIWYQS